MVWYDDAEAREKHITLRLSAGELHKLDSLREGDTSRRHNSRSAVLRMLIDDEYRRRRNNNLRKPAKKKGERRG